MRPGGGASTRRHALTATRRLLVASSLIVAVAASAAVTAGATTTQRGQAPVTVHVLPATFHQGYAKALNSVSAAQATAPKGYSYARGVHPARSAAKIGDSCAESNCPLPDNGGAVQHTPHVYLLFWGPNWQSDSTQDAALLYTAHFFQGLGVTTNDVWSPIMDQYYDSSGNIGFGSSVYENAYQDTSSPPYDTSQSQLAAEDNAFLSSEGITDTADAQVIIATQPGTCPNGFSPGGCPGAHNYCAWHSYANSPYTNLPYQPDAGTSCGEYSVSGVNDGFSIVGGHEYAETATDPFLNAWIDNSDPGGGEIGDKCVWTDLQFTYLSTGAYPTQPLWSNSQYYGTGYGCTQNEFDLSLSPSTGSLSVGQTVSLQATTNISVTPTPWYIVIIDATTDTIVGACGAGSVCNASVTGDYARTDYFYAQISESNGVDAKLATGEYSVTWDPASSATAVSIGLPAASAGGKATVNVSVTGAFPGSGVVAPVGAVTVSDGTRTCMATLSGSNGASTGTCQLKEPNAGSLTVSASFAGDSNFTASSNTTPLAVGKATSSTAFTLSKASIAYGSQKNEVFTIKVTAAKGGTPSGKVGIYQGFTKVCGATLYKGKATCSLKAKELKKGSHTLYAYFGGDKNHLYSSSKTAKLKIT
jgi:serine protease